MKIQYEGLGYKTLSECVMDYLKRQMSEGALKPGDEIDTNALGQILGVSRTPIREALIQLTKDGFIETGIHKSFRIRKITLKDIENIYQVIGILEAEACKAAVDKLAPEEIAHLEKLFHQMEMALELDDFKSYLDLNDQTHAKMLQCCNNPFLIGIVKQSKERLYGFPPILFNIPEWEKEMMDDHRRMIEFLKRGDKQGLADLIKNHHWSFERNYPYLIKYYDLSSGES